MKTKKELIEDLQKNNPGLRVAETENAIGYYCECLNMHMIIYGQLITGEWVNMPMLLVDGKPAIPEEDWKAVDAIMKAKGE